MFCLYFVFAFSCYILEDVIFPKEDVIFPKKITSFGENKFSFANV